MEGDAEAGIETGRDEERQGERRGMVSLMMKVHKFDMPSYTTLDVNPDFSLDDQVSLTIHDQVSLSLLLSYCW